MAADTAAGEAAPPSAMRAWQYSKYGGGADALHLTTSAPVPAPKAGELLVRVQSSSVNPVDWKLQSGIARGILPRFFPFTPGLDVAGEVVQLGAATGPQAVGALGVGDQVFGGLDFMTGGGFAEYAILSSKAAARRPPELTPAEAACFGVAGLTALQTLRDWGKLPMGAKVEGAYDPPRPNAPAAAASDPNATAPAPVHNVLVANAAGGVGYYAVQLAKLAGAHVTATCGARNMELIKSLGADEVLDYKTPEGEALQSPSGRKYDVILDGTLHLTWSKVSPVLAPAGRWVCLTPNASTMLNIVLNAISPFARQRVLTMLVSPDAADLAALGRLSAEGLLKIKIDAEVPFDKAPDSWRTSMEGHVVGKVVVTMGK